MRVRHASIEDAGAIAPLFSAYCAFYEKDVDPERGGAFVRERMEAGDAEVFLAEADAGEAIGLAVLYPKWSSTGLRRDWLLNDLFVAPDHRRRGVAKALLDAVAAFGRETGANKLSLKTQSKNAGARALYEREGWAVDEDFLTYHLRLA